MISLLVFLNGPPKSGKDTIANAYRDSNPVDSDRKPIGVRTVKFAQPIRNALLGTFPAIKPKDLEMMKDQPIFPPRPHTDYQSDITFRQWMINYSEYFMKPMFGRDIFGRLAEDRIREICKHSSIPDVVIITDSGFREEALHLISAFDCESILIKLKRPGYTFEGDSRGYIELPPSLVNEATVENSGTVAEAAQQLHHLVQRFLPCQR